jgi:putative Mg2+ transporter-C (MgtC) family protein
MLDHGTIILRLIVAGALGAIIGYERDRHKRSAGLRTHLLVALASALFMVISMQFSYHQPFSSKGIIEVDVSRIASTVVSGAGFLAGGAILRSGLSVQGMTTAAGLWLVAAIGMAAGSGMFSESVVATLLGLFSLWLLRLLEGKSKRDGRSRLILQIAGEPSLTELRSLLEQSGVMVTRYAYTKQGSPEPSIRANFTFRHADSFDHDSLVRTLEQRPGVRSVSVERRG